jgi:hypothetical protein
MPLRRGFSRQGTWDMCQSQTSSSRDLGGESED